VENQQITPTDGSTQPMEHGRSNNEPDLLLSDSLRGITRWASTHPKFTLAVTIGLATICVGITIALLDFKTKRADLIDPKAPFHQRWLNYTKSFGESSDIVVVVEADEPGKIKLVIDDLGSRLTRESELFSNVLYKIEPGQLAEKGLYYLTPEQLDSGLERLQAFRPIAQGNWDLIQLDSLFERLLDQIRDHRTKPTSQDAQPLLRHVTLLSTSLVRFLADRNDFRSPWPDLLPGNQWLRDEAKQVTYFLNDRGTMGFLKVFPADRLEESDGPSRSIDRLRQLIAKVSIDHPAANISLTGIPVLENDEMRKSQFDMFKASLISVAGVGLLLFLGFRGIRHPLLALLMLAVGMSWTFGYTTVAVGHLNILSVSFGVILIGLGIDFAIHYLARYLQLRHEGESLLPALLETSSGVGTGIVTAAVTTALAFFCATLTSFLGVAELGIIAGGGILLCAVATFLVLPALVTLADGRVEPRMLPTPFQAVALRQLTARYPVIVMLLSFLVIGFLGSCALSWKDGRITLEVDYDYNLLNLQAEGLESVQVQKRMFQEPRGSLLYAVSLADSPAEARRLRAKFEMLPTVDHVEEMGSWLPTQPLSQIQLRVQAFAAELSWLNNQPPKFSDPNPRIVGTTVEEFFKEIRNLEHPMAVDASQAIDAFLDEFEKLSTDSQIAFLNQYQQHMLTALLGQFQALLYAADSEPVTLDDLPSELRSRFVSPRGKWLVQVYPKDQIWDIQPLSRFVADVRSVDMDVTGTPLQNYEASRQIMDSYQTAAIYALAIICLVLLIGFLGRDHAMLATLLPLVLILIVTVGISAHLGRIEIDLPVVAAAYAVMTLTLAALLDFRSLRETLLAIFSPLAGGLLMFGVLALLGVDLNPANLIVLPLVLGIGVDNGVHVIHDFRMQRHRYQTSSSTISGVVLTSLTSMIGFGSMMVAAHRGLYSLGLVLVIGVGSCLFVSMVTLPAILTIVSRYGRNKDRPTVA